MMDNPVLQARDARWHERLRLAAAYNLPVLSSTLRLPYALRLEYGAVLRAQVCVFLRSLPVTPVFNLVRDTADGTEALAVLSMPVGDLKRAALEYEALPVGTLLDLDIMSAGGTPVSRDAMNLPPRSCLLCNEPARECVLLRRHTEDEVRRQVEGLLRQQD